MAKPVPSPALAAKLDKIAQALAEVTKPPLATRYNYVIFVRPEDGPEICKKLIEAVHAHESGCDNLDVQIEYEVSRWPYQVFEAGDPQTDLSAFVRGVAWALGCDMGDF